jgi:hypothetical protein
MYSQAESAFIGWAHGGQGILFPVVFTPPPRATTAVFGSYLSSLYS